jgi:DNA transposition AAA+ family ATPase
MLGDNYEDFVKKSESVVTKNASNEEVYTLKSSIKLKDLSYKLIIVDEATHLDTLTLSVLS